MINEATNDSFIVSEPGSYTVVVFGEEGCESQPSVPQIVGTTGIHTILNSADLKFYPNPVSGLFTITFPDNQVNTIIEVYQLNGKYITNHVVDGRQARFNVKDYPDGVYIAKVITGTGELVKTIRFVKE